jgi:hypothetical protein
MYPIAHTKEIEEAWDHADIRTVILAWSFVGFSVLLTVSILALGFAN